jgi:hypothetical protein
MIKPCCGRRAACYIMMSSFPANIAGEHERKKETALPHKQTVSQDMEVRVEVQTQTALWGSKAW